MAKKNNTFPQPTDNNALYALHSFLNDLLKSAAGRPAGENVPNSPQGHALRDHER